MNVGVLSEVVPHLASRIIIISVTAMLLKASVAWVPESL